MRTNYKWNSVIVYIYTSVVGLLVVCMLVFVSNIRSNKGLLPLIFALIIFFYLLVNASYRFSKQQIEDYKKKKFVSVLYIINFVLKLLISIIVFILSIYVFWL